MIKMALTLLMGLSLASSYGQQRRISGYLTGQYTQTLYDATANNNPWGMGVGVLLMRHCTSAIKPMLDVSADVYLEDDKVMRINPGGEAYETVRGMANFFVGASYHPLKNFFVSASGGPSLVGHRTRFGIKPAIGVYLSTTQRTMARLYYLNVFKREKITEQHFGSAGISVAVKLF